MKQLTIRRLLLIAGFLAFLHPALWPAHAETPATKPADGRLTPAELKQWGWDQEIVRPDGLQIHWAVRNQSPVDGGWTLDRFPAHAACYRTPKELADLYAATTNGKEPGFVSYPKPTDGSLRIVGTGHSFMAPGYGTLPTIANAAGLKQQRLVVHGGGGVTGSARYKWEEENGIFAFDQKPKPKLLASIANAEWDAMMWGPYFYDRPAYYACWIDFCLKYNPKMKFYLVDTWPGIGELSKMPASEDDLAPEVLAQMTSLPQTTFAKIVKALNEEYPGKVFLVPMSDAMLIAAKLQKEGKLPGVEGLHKLVGKKDRSLWVDQIGHLGPGFNLLEGYVFYAAVYGRNPEKIEGTLSRERDFPSPELDKAFRTIAWQAVTGNELSGVKP